METEVWNARELSQEEVISTLGNRFEVSYGKAASELFAFMDEAENEFSLKQVKQIPFCWEYSAAGRSGGIPWPRALSARLSTAAIRPAATCLPFLIWQAGGDCRQLA